MDDQELLDVNHSAAQQNINAGPEICKSHTETFCPEVLRVVQLLLPGFASPMFSQYVSMKDFQGDIVNHFQSFSNINPRLLESKTAHFPAFAP